MSQETFVNTGDTAGGAVYTIDELAARTGVPSRTIRFYQAKGVLPAPEKRGRVAVYTDNHAERLKVVSDLQNRGLRLRAIRDLCKRGGESDIGIQEWLGLGEHLGGWSEDNAQLLSEDQLRELAGDYRPGMLTEMIHAGRIEARGEGAQRRFLLESPGLFKMAVQLDQAGIDVDTCLAMHEILLKRLGRAADELVQLAVERAGKGFGRSASPSDLLQAVKALRPAGTETVRLMFQKEMDRATTELVTAGGSTPRKLRGRP
jgi:DNA-binding transcriptional MerR regulator